MKRHFQFAAVLIAFYCVASASAQNRLDITLQGPWILYVDTAFAGGTPVLVAFSPGSQSRFAHKRPFFGAGNGLPIKQPGTYCVGFDKTCALNRNRTALSTDGYPANAAKPVPVTAPAAGWKWFEHKSYYATYLVFPMPDSWSDDGTYRMTFGKQFMSYNYADEEEHSVGVQLHYDKGPAEIELFGCGADPRKAADCTPTGVPPVGSLPNTGTLEVQMKAPSTIADYACDYHVRSVYPQMLHLLDPDPNDISTAPQNQNLDKAFIDIPSDIDPSTGKGTYDSDCYKCDEQGSNLSQCNHLMTSDQSMSGSTVYEPNLDVAHELGLIIENLEQPGLDEKALQVTELTKVKDSLKGGVFPTFSQLEWLDALLTRSSAALSTYLELELRKANAESRQKKTTLVATDRFTGLEGTLFRMQRLTVYVDTQDATKDGKDCRAPLMLLK